MNQVMTRMHMAEVTIGCGMTETSPLATQTAPEDPVEKRVATVGRPHPHVEIKVVDPATGETLPHGAAGEQCMRGYNVMLGYWNDEEATRAAVDEDGWMHSGDLATLDEDGYVAIVGRIKDMIIRGGDNIYPREIEEFLITLPEIAEAYVVGVPSARYGEEVMAFVRLAEGASPAEDDLVSACKGRIATIKIPRYWRFVDEFPMTVTGKIQKFKLREQASPSWRQAAGLRLVSRCGGAGRRRACPRSDSRRARCRAAPCPRARRRRRRARPHRRRVGARGAARAPHSAASSATTATSFPSFAT